MEQLTLTNILLLIITIAVAIVAIKITFSFDINKYLNDKKDEAKNKAKNSCTHIDLRQVSWNIILESSFISPAWTNLWFCQKCWLQKHYVNEGQESERIQYYIDNPKEYLKQEKRFEKYLKKAWFL